MVGHLSLQPKAAARCVSTVAARPEPMAERAANAVKRRQTGGGRSSHGGRQAVPADRRLEPSERHACRRVHARIHVLQPRNEAAGVLRECRRFELAQRDECIVTHLRIGVLEAIGEGGSVLGELRRLQLAQRDHCAKAHIRVGMLELGGSPHSTPPSKTETVLATVCHQNLMTAMI